MDPLLDNGWHALITLTVLGLALPTLVALIFITAPYGRHTRTGWGPTIPTRLGWIIMESPSSLGFAAIFALGAYRSELVPLVLLGFWQVHYLHRTFIFPFRMRTEGRRMFVSIVAMGVLFNLLNAYINARYDGAMEMAFLLQQLGAN